MQVREGAGGESEDWRERSDALQIRPRAGGSDSQEGVHAGAGARERGQGGGRHITGPSKYQIVVRHPNPSLLVPQCTKY